jgi:hypothetical protein
MERAQQKYQGSNGGSREAIGRRLDSTPEKCRMLCGAKKKHTTPFKNFWGSQGGKTSRPIPAQGIKGKRASSAVSE